MIFVENIVLEKKRKIVLCKPEKKRKRKLFYEILIKNVQKIEKQKK